MYDKFNRKINYLRVSVTDRCNLRCVYCMPPEGIDLVKHKEVLRFNEIEETVKFAVDNGIDKIRITGGEPLIRKGIVNLVEIIAKIKGIKDLAMTTNAIFLEKFAKPLAEAGLHRVNISLDSIDENKYREITQGGDINLVFKGIEAAKKEGLTPVKINCVIKKSANEPDAKAVKEYCDKNGLSVRYIHEMNLETGEFEIVEGGTGGNCKICNRLRITATGDILPCLFSDEKFNIRKMGIKQAFKLALENKPENGCFAKNNKFYNIGG